MCSIFRASIFGSLLAAVVLGFGGLEVEKDTIKVAQGLAIFR
jgi:hypothetical protein